MEKLKEILNLATSVPLDDGAFLKLVLTACVAALILGFIGRLIFGKRSGLNHAVSSALGILFLYVLGILLYGAGLHFEKQLTSLPFVSVSDGDLLIFPLLSADFSLVCSQVLRMMILAFLMNLLDIWIPKGKNIFTWILLRCVTLLAAMTLQGLVFWAVGTYLPEVFQTWAPMILLIVLVAMLLLGALKVLVGLALATVNPIIGALYTFFFANIVGKQISKAALTTILLALLVIALEKAGYILVSLSALTLPILIPVLLVLLVLWYVVGHLL